jgi:hypothetical protein
VCSGVVPLIEYGPAFMDDTRAIRVCAAFASGRVVVRSDVKWHVPNECEAAWVVGAA